MRNPGAAPNVFWKIFDLSGPNVLGQFRFDGPSKNNEAFCSRLNFTVSTSWDVEESESSGPGSLNIQTLSDIDNFYQEWEGNKKWIDVREKKISLLPLMTQVTFSRMLDVVGT